MSDQDVTEAAVTATVPEDSGEAVSAAPEAEVSIAPEASEIAPEAGAATETVAEPETPEVEAAAPDEATDGEAADNNAADEEAALPLSTTCGRVPLRPAKIHPRSAWSSSTSLTSAPSSTPCHPISLRAERR